MLLSFLLLKWHIEPIEHSANKIIYFENEVGPGVHQSSVDRTCSMQQFHIPGKHVVSGLSFLSSAFLQWSCWSMSFLNSSDCVMILFLKCSIQHNLCFINPCKKQICHRKLIIVGIASWHFTPYYFIAVYYLHYHSFSKPNLCMTQLQMDHCRATNIFAAYYLQHHSFSKPNLSLTQLQMDHCRATNIFAAYYLHHHSFSKPNLCITQLQMDHCRATNIFAAYYLHHHSFSKRNLCMTQLEMDHCRATNIFAGYLEPITYIITHLANQIYV